MAPGEDEEVLPERIGEEESGRTTVEPTRVTEPGDKGYEYPENQEGKEVGGDGSGGFSKDSTEEQAATTEEGE